MIENLGIKWDSKEVIQKRMAWIPRRVNHYWSNEGKYSIAGTRDGSLRWLLDNQSTLTNRDNINSCTTVNQRVRQKGIRFFLMCLCDVSDFMLICECLFLFAISWISTAMKNSSIGESLVINITSLDVTETGNHELLSIIKEWVSNAILKLPLYQFPAEVPDDGCNASLPLSMTHQL
jgi:hypothetical protein